MFLQADAGACFNSKEEEKIERQRNIIELCIATARGTDDISKYYQLLDMSNIYKMVIIHIYTLLVCTHLGVRQCIYSTIPVGYNKHKITGAYFTFFFLWEACIIRYDDYLGMVPMGITSLARAVEATTCIHSWGDITLYDVLTI